MTAARLTLAAAYGQAPPVDGDRTHKLQWVRERGRTDCAFSYECLTPRPTRRPPALYFPFTVSPDRVSRSSP